ncbi:nucleoid-associated protein [Aquincola sp. J276]|uniref:nucleoid-associated protein n=1 Tax=Aquincola sp. J276 TaxID=2898432 RepID=UPI0021512623|nr:nucleoid-associated protein [Aquincola sp. J276]MCR5868206.1 nucleoid-associated protein [Aquincola sp. J276]
MECSSGYPPRRLVCIIKAEVHSGFLRRSDADGNLEMSFLKGLMLTPHTKMYKIGAFMLDDAEAQSPIRAFIYDDQMTLRNRMGAAQYFYEKFLGLAFPESAARNTKSFYELTKNFIKLMNVPEDEKVELHNALITYLKTDQRSVISVGDFASGYLPSPDAQDAYRDHMVEQNGFSDAAIHKDTSEIGASLRVRKVVFSSDIRLTATPEQFREKVTIREFRGEPQGDGPMPIWTEILVKDHIKEQ